VWYRERERAERERERGGGEGPGRTEEDIRKCFFYIFIFLFFIFIFILYYYYLFFFVFPFFAPWGPEPILNDTGQRTRQLRQWKLIRLTSARRLVSRTSPLPHFLPSLRKWADDDQACSRRVMELPGPLGGLKIVVQCILICNSYPHIRLLLRDTNWFSTQLFILRLCNSKTMAGARDGAA